MQLSPRYGSDPVVVVDEVTDDIVTPTISQRRRLADALGALTDDQWAHPSRCAEWDVRDVVAHLVTTNQFWAASVLAGVRREPTRILATFDPVSSPAGMVEATRDTPPSEVLAGYRSTTDSLAEVLTSLDGGDLDSLAEAPPGHVAVRAVLHHALWDAWVHERDILLPLGIEPVEADDEIAACLGYAIALGPALAIGRGRTMRGTLAVDAVDPDVAMVAEVGERVTVRPGRGAADLTLTGGSVEVLEALSMRRPIDQTIPPGAAWLLAGLAEQFDAA